MSEWMLWSRFGGSVQLGSAPPPRLYFIPVSTSIEHEGPLAPQLGHRNRDERTLEGVTRALDRAESGEFDGVIFPSSILTCEFRYEVYARCASRNLRIVHQVTTHALFPDLHSPPRPALDPGTLDRTDELMRRLDAGDALNLVFGANSTPKETWLARLTRWPDQVYFTYSARNRDPVLEMLHALQPFVRERLFFHFPYHLEFGDGNFSCQQIYELTEKIHTRVPGVRVRPQLGNENFDPRVDPSLELEPLHGPTIALTVSQPGVSTSSRKTEYDVSVIIPSYNNRDYLVNTIKHLFRQNYPRERYEVVVVDDGSNDGSIDAVRELVPELKGKACFKYIYSPRAKPRKMGDANYRAGISRNLGVKNANGRIFCFLDSDILTPPHFVQDLVEKHRKFDVIQCKRLNLVREKSNAEIRYDEVDASKDTFTTEDGYWEKFYALTNWPKAPFFWKYTCTYGLSVTASLFKRVGWIRRGFVFYGFEDVELGYRLARVGSRFHLNDMVTYHLFHKNERSEFHNSDYLRQSLLAKTAQIFYLGLLEQEIFFHFRGLMKEQLPLIGALRLLAARLGLIKLFDRLVQWSQKKSVVAAAARKTVGALKIPFLAVWNWRWFLWRQWGRVKAHAWIVKMPFVWLGVLLKRMGFKAEAIGHRTAGVLAWAGAKSKAVVGQTWKVRVATTRAIDAMALWRISVWTKSLWGQRWRLVVSAKRISDLLQLWRISAFLKSFVARLQLWRLKVLWERIASQYWRVELVASKAAAALQLWRLKILGRFIVSQTWRLRVGAIRLSGVIRKFLSSFEFWRVRVAAFRILGAIRKTISALELWRLKLVWSKMASQSWRVRVLKDRLIGTVKKYAAIFRAVIRRDYLSPLKPPLRAMTYPIRKIYYVLAYQWDKRVRGKTREQRERL